MQVKIDEFNKIKGHFIAEIRKREKVKHSVNILPRLFWQHFISFISNKLRCYIASFSTNIVASVGINIACLSLWQFCSR